jgi:ATP-dependent RNA helicase DDX3X
MFSATFPKAGRELAKQYLSASHVRFRVGRAGSSHKNIKQIVIQVEPHEKRKRLLELLSEMPGVRTIVFVATRRAVDEIDDLLFNVNFPVTSIHADRTQMEREAALRAFRSGKAPILIASGVTARGIDVKGVFHVINYDLPQDIEDYTHRIGRTGRAGWRGVATSFMTERDAPMSETLTKFLIETDQDVPDFLQSYVPIGDAREHLKFESDSDAEEQHATKEAGAAGWGAPDPDITGSAPGAGWGGESSTGVKEEASGWGSAAPGANANAQWGVGQDGGSSGAVGGW